MLWAPGGQTRPHSAPKEVTAKHRTSHFYIRRYSSTVEAKGEDQRELLSLTATVPFDDRMCRAATIDDLSLPLLAAGWIIWIGKENRSKLQLCIPQPRRVRATWAGTAAL